MSPHNRFSEVVYCAMRLIVGLLFACHGGQLVLGMFGGMPIPPTLTTNVGGSVQLIGGLLIAFGLFTRIAAFICSGEMAVAYFAFHFAKAPNAVTKFFPLLNEGELSVIYCWVFLFIFFYGPGQWSLDALVRAGPAAA
jgi:putative oxidoreductase